MDLLLELVLSWKGRNSCQKKEEDDVRHLLRPSFWNLRNQGFPSEILETTWSACCVVELMVHIGLELNIADLAQIGWFTSLSSSATLYKNSVCERKPALLFAFGNYSSMERHLVPYALLWSWTPYLPSVHQRLFFKRLKASLCPLRYWRKLLME